MTKNYPLILAHRGAKGLVKFENTFEAFDKALEVGADGIELDVRKTKDNILIINHDPSINDIIIKDKTYEELLTITKSLGYILPKFEDVLIKYGNITLLDIELKETGYEEEIITLTTKYLSYDKYFIKSFRKSSIIKIKELDKNIKTSLLIGERYNEDGILGRFYEVFPKKLLKKTNCDVLSPNRLLLILNYLKRVSKYNIPINVWTVNEEKELRNLMKSKYCPKYIITNYPDLAIKIREEIYKK